MRVDSRSVWAAFTLWSIDREGERERDFDIDE